MAGRKGTPYPHESESGVRRVVAKDLVVGIHGLWLWVTRGAELDRRVFRGRRVDRALEREGSAIAHEIGREVCDEGPHYATAYEHAPSSRHDVHVDMRARVKSCRSLHQHTTIGDVQHIQLATRTHANACERLLPIGNPARRSRTLAATGVGRGVARDSRRLPTWVVEERTQKIATHARRFSSYRSRRVRPVAPSTRIAYCDRSAPRIYRLPAVAVPAGVNDSKLLPPLN